MPRIAGIALVLLLAAGAAVFLLSRSNDRGAAPPAPPLSASSPLARPGPTARALKSAPPVTLEIPKIGVRTDLMTLGKNPDGTLEVPPLSRVDEAGWYRLGPSPGSTGPAVIAGHVDSKDGPGVFYRLGELRPGDTVKVVRKDGVRLTFQVDALERVPKDRFPTQKVYGRIKFPGLRLITCGGRFDAGDGHYVDNIIVYAHLIATKRNPEQKTARRSGAP
ncbi:class F sortase [Sphaerimonospora sp. CA-214678]|uniref:class F sortase n=1 Tax=Sphaerimonospora sp. CA-214678 TaxID=3240029 RepID=UPI003D904924